MSDAMPAGAMPADAMPARAIPQIVACQDGPLLVRGTIELHTASGELIPQNRRTVALCRCGVSMIKPFCDGSHKAIRFRTE